MRDRRDGGATSVTGVLVLGVVLGAGVGGCGRLNEEPEPSTAFHRADAVFHDLAESSPEPLPGYSASVGVDDAIVFSRARGFADIVSERPASPGTRFRIYSTSKALTAVAAMTLVERGKLHLDRPLSQYLPSLPEPVAAATPRQLLSHRSGVRHYRTNEWMAVSRKRCGSPKEAFEYFIDDPLEFAPGSETLYTSFGFVLLSAVIEAAAGVPFGSYVETSVLAPAGMAATSIEGLAVEGHETATFYYRRDDDGTFRETSDVDASCKFGGGGFLSTSEDLVRFGLALVEGRLLSDRSLETLWTLYSEPTPSRPGLALGFFSGDSLKEGLGVSEEHYLASWWHGGSGEGGYSALIVYPEHGAAVAVTTNVLASGRLIVAANEIAWEVLAALEAVKSP